MLPVFPLTYRFVISQSSIFFGTVETGRFSWRTRFLLPRWPLVRLPTEARDFLEERRRRMISLNDATVHIEAGHSCERGYRIPLSESHRREIPRRCPRRPFFRFPSLARVCGISSPCPLCPDILLFVSRAFAQRNDIAQTSLSISAPDRETGPRTFHADRLTSYRRAISSLKEIATKTPWTSNKGEVNSVSNSYLEIILKFAYQCSWRNSGYVRGRLT